MPSPMIDLHTHSNVSDGQYAPHQLIQKAVSEGVTAMALTDHDAIGGLEEAAAEAAKTSLEFVPGIEMSAFIGEREIHLLGHFIDAHDPVLTGFIARMKKARVVRMRKMIARLGENAGIDVTFDEVAAYCRGQSIGRTHLAQALQAKGVVHSFREAFDRFIGRGKPGYVERDKVAAQEAIQLIHGAGGTVTLAHALAYHVTRDEIRALAAMGLDGLEVEHPDHDAAMRETLAIWAPELGLVPTGGSDFHGEAVIPERHLGDGRTPPDSLERLRRKSLEFQANRARH